MIFWTKYVRGSEFTASGSNLRAGSRQCLQQGGTCNRGAGAVGGAKPEIAAMSRLVITESRAACG